MSVINLYNEILTNYIYLYHLEKFCVLPSMPDSISDQMQSTFRSTTALSRSAPVQSYSNSGPRTITFTIILHRDIMEDLNTGVSNLKDNVLDISDKDYVDILLNYLQARALPKYNVYKTGSKVVDPPQVAVKMGNDIFIRGVISGSVGVTYEKPILDNGKYAKVTVTIPVTEVDPYDAPTVAMKGGFRGITSTFKNGIFKGEEDSLAYSAQEYVTQTTSSKTTTLNTIVDSLRDPNIGSILRNQYGSNALPQKKVPGNNSLTMIDTSKLPSNAWNTDSDPLNSNNNWLTLDKMIQDRVSTNKRDKNDNWGQDTSRLDVDTRGRKINW